MRFRPPEQTRKTHAAEKGSLQNAGFAQIATPALSLTALFNLVSKSPEKMQQSEKHCLWLFISPCLQKLPMPEHPEDTSTTDTPGLPLECLWLAMGKGGGGTPEKNCGFWSQRDRKREFVSTICGSRTAGVARCWIPSSPRSNSHPLASLATILGIPPPPQFYPRSRF